MMFKFIREHKQAVAYLIAGLTITVMGTLYVSLYNDHVDTQKELVTLKNMQEDLTEMKNLLKSSNTMMTTFAQHQAETKVTLEQYGIRLENVEHFCYANKK